MVFVTASVDALEIDSSQNVKIPTGGLGVGTDETTAGALTTTGAITAGGALAGTTVTATGGTTTGVGSNILYKVISAATNADATIKFSDNYGYNNYISGGNQQISFQPQTAGTVVAQVTPTGLTVTGTGTFSGALTASGALTTGGILDHGGFPTVNSSTVQGLQDGACYDFDGTDDKIDLGIIDYSDFTGLTISCWFKSDDFTASRTLASNWGQSGNYGWLLFNGHFADNRISWLIGSGSSYNEMRNTTDLSTGQWYHVVCTWVSGTQKMYIDGVLDITDSSGVPTSLYDVNFKTSIGVDHDATSEAATRFFNGQIRDVKIFP
ncbi:MAG TPA: LamG domain-containing protein, partial [Flavobacteriales bacterium]|nr:LamG domain-containing protein [Flavobacteriales bacterium]